MNEIFKQILIGVTIAAIAGAWAFASTRASVASVQTVMWEVEELEDDIDHDIEKIGSDIDDLKTSVNNAILEQREFRAQVREKLQISSN